MVSCTGLYMKDSSPPAHKHFIFERYSCHHRGKDTSREDGLLKDVNVNRN